MDTLIDTIYVDGYCTYVKGIQICFENKLTYCFWYSFSETNMALTGQVALTRVAPVIVQELQD